jgi:hypothetical protein
VRVLVLTTGKHYKCAERLLRESAGDSRIVGLFVARRVHKDPIDDFTVVEEL